MLGLWAKTKCFYAHIVIRRCNCNGKHLDTAPEAVICRKNFADQFKVPAN